MPTRTKSTADLKELQSSIYVNIERNHEAYVCIHYIIESIGSKCGISFESKHIFLIRTFVIRLARKTVISDNTTQGSTYVYG
jgi:hypothetical protein